MKHRAAMTHNTHTHCGSRRAFTLVEVLGVLALIAIICTFAIMPILRIIEEAKARAEQSSLKLLAAEIKSTFRMEDLEQHNVSALPGEMPTVLLPTFFEKAHYASAAESAVLFYTGTEACVDNAWYAKLARLRGQGPLNTTLNATEGPVREIVFNNYKRRRILIAGPQNEQYVQRYLLLSFAFPLTAGDNFEISPAPSEALGNSMADYTSWFDGIYNHSWGVAKGPPAGWSDKWSQESSTGKTYAQRVLVERITQRRFEVTVNNTSNEYELHMFANMANTNDFEDSLNKAKYFVDSTGLFDATGVFRNTLFGTHRGFLEGRRVRAFRVVIPPPPDPLNPTPTTPQKYPMYSFLINENTTVTMQD